MGGAELLLMGLCMVARNDTNATTDGNCTLQTDRMDFDAVLEGLEGDRPIRNITMPKQLRVSTLEDMPLSGTILRNGTLIGVGYAFYLLDLLSAKLNFTYTIELPKENVLGWTDRGIFGQLYRKEVDMAIAFLPMIPSAQILFNYSVALDEVEWTILMKRPQASATGSGLLAPFDTTVWILILISLIVVGPTIYFLIYIRSRISKDEKPGKYSLSACMWFVYGALLKQGSTISPATDSARLLFATWWIFITILTSFYTANLTAFLTLSQFTLPINSVADLANKHQKWAAQRGRTIDLLINKDEDTLEPLRKSSLRGHGEFISFDDKAPEYILQLVEQNKMFLREKPMAQSLIFDDYKNKTRDGVEEPQRCTYVIMPGNILVKGRAFAFPAASPIAKIIDKELLALVESGIIKYVMAQDLPAIEICPLNLGSNERQLQNSDLSMTYSVVFAGFTVANIVFVAELIYRCKQRRDKRKELKRSPKLPVYNGDSPNDFLKRSPPPLYQNINTRNYSKIQFINGRDYYIVTEQDGDKRLVPVRTPSAFLFQYAA